MRMIQKRVLIFFTLITFTFSICAQNKTENIVLITLDGVRPQEIFSGLDLSIVKAAAKDKPFESQPLYKKYWAATPEERRARIMPFFWNVLMRKQGSIAGNRALGSTAQVTNKHWFSYPGYSEILTGQAHDDVIKSNDNIRNPYPSVLEFLKRKMQLNKNKVAVFAAWETIGFAAEHQAGTIFTNTGYQVYPTSEPLIEQLNKLQFEADTAWDGERSDAYTFYFAMAHLKNYQPRVLYLSLGETDEWAHSNRYDRVLQTMTLADNYLKQLWEFLQSQSQYKDKTTIVITTDHGRGLTVKDWNDHGSDVEGAQYIWLAVVSPDVSLRGEWKNSETVYQNQIAATVAKFLNFDYSEQNPQAGKPISRFF